MEIIIILVLLVVLFLFIALCCIRLVQAIVSRSKTKQQKKQQKEQFQASIAVELKHFSGLPLPENAMCQIFVNDEMVIMQSGGQQYNLKKENITDIQMISDTEIQQQYVSSVGGAVGGAMLFGPIGAMIGGRAKQKTSKQIQYYLIISYHTENQPKYIAFYTGPGAWKLVNDFKTYASEKPNLQIDL